ncbi:hypothetical protein NXS19_012077 [Fusarium pseudograminearum]|nr:hypothetical protein NXS19_012077 [Fusarium pseudograminearum]
MASVSSLDKDLRKMRLEKYTPAAANEARSWIEDMLGETLPSPDLLEGLKDGVALCKLANRALPPPGLRFKKSAMPFVQMENISLFLRACQSPPLNLQQHDTFLTVDLFEQKDPAQVLQCIGAFSRAAHSAYPQNFPVSIGPKNRPDTVTPQGTGSRTPTGTRDRGASVTSNKSPAFGRSAMMPHRTGDSGSGRWSPTKSPRNRPESPSAVSSWSKKEHEGTTSPAWNIAQYGYLGGASQGNLGISFGGRRQITNASPRVPNLADKERRRKEEEERARLEAEEDEKRRFGEEERARLEEEHRWEEETEQLRQKEREAAEEEKRRWEEEERQWQLTEEQRRKEEEEAEARLEAERKSLKSRNDSKLTGQFLSQYRTEQGASQQDGASEDDYKNRVKQLEQELELARQREAEYERERQERGPRQGSVEVKPTPKPKPKLISSPQAALIRGPRMNERSCAPALLSTESQCKQAHLLCCHPGLLVLFLTRLRCRRQNHPNLAAALFLILRHTHPSLPLRLPLQLAPIASCPENQLPRSQRPRPHTLASSAPQLNKTLRTYAVPRVKTRPKLVDGRQSRSWSAKWKWNDNGSESGKSHKKKPLPQCVPTTA